MGELENGEMSVQSMGEMGKDFCPNFFQPFLENIDSGNRNDKSRELSPVLHNPHQKMPTLSFDGGSQLGVPCRGALLGRVEQEGGKQVRINIKKVREYLEGRNQVSPKSPPLQRTKALPLQPLFVVEVTHATY